MNKKQITAIVIIAISLIVLIASAVIYMLSQNEGNDPINDNTVVTDIDSSDALDENDDQGEFSEDIETIEETVPSDITKEEPETSVPEKGDEERQLTAQLANESPSELETFNKLDRDKMRQAVDAFVPVYFELSPSRHMALSSMVDINYLNSIKNDSVLYMDYVLNDGNGYSFDKYTSYIKHDIVSIDNASVGNGIVRVHVILDHMIEYDSTDEAPGTQYGIEEGDFVYQVFLSDDYKIRDIKFVTSSIH